MITKQSNVHCKHTESRYCDTFPLSQQSHNNNDNNDNNDNDNDNNDDNKSTTCAELNIHFLAQQPVHLRSFEEHLEA